MRHSPKGLRLERVTLLLLLLLLLILDLLAQALRFTPWLL